NTPSGAPFATNPLPRSSSLRASIVDVERINAGGSYGTNSSCRCQVAGNDDHPRSAHVTSPRFERQVQVGQHVGRKLLRNQLPLGVDDAEPFEPLTRTQKSHPCHLGESAAPLRAILLEVEIEVVERASGSVLCWWPRPRLPACPMRTRRTR